MSANASVTRRVAEVYGLAWVRRSGGEVRFRSPVFAGERVHCVPMSTACTKPRAPFAHRAVPQAIANRVFSEELVRCA